MRLHSLQLQQFRSYGELELDLSSGDVHVLVGPNGAGKTNVLEAVSLLSFAKSCLGADEGDLLQWDMTFYRVRGSGWTDAGEQRQLEVVSQIAPRAAKVCYLNDVKVSVDSMVGVLPTVLFLPQDLQLFLGAPSLRRRFLDRLLCQVSPEYLRSFTQYQKLLKQRNALLRRVQEGANSATDLDAWDHHIVSAGVPITLARLELIGTLALTLPEEIRTLGEQWSQIEIVYESSCEGSDAESLRSAFLTKLSSCRSRDIAMQSTTVGPHREDWSVMIDGRSLSTFASRGQQRTALLALLLLQVSYVELRLGEKPVILLDDVFSELDDHHQRCLLESLGGYQVVLTTTRMPSGAPEENVTVWDVSEGNVHQTAREPAHLQHHRE